MEMLKKSHGARVELEMKHKKEKRVAVLPAWVKHAMASGIS